MSFTLEPTPFAPPPPLDLKALAATRRPLAPGLDRALLASGAAEAGRAQLASGEALCVTTGQQPGLFTGPLFTIHKAATAIALARHASVALGRPVVPVFWVAGDDHDYAEANHAYLLTAENDVRRLALPERAPDAPLTPLYRESLGAAVSGLLDAARAAMPATEFLDATFAWLARHYQPERDLASAFAGAMAELFAAQGLVVFRPTHPAAKRAMAPLLLEVLERSGEADQALARRAEALARAGQAVPVPVGDGAVPVMMEGRLGRDRLVSASGAFHARRSRESWTLDELVRVADREPERLSPNVLLRPAIEAAILPTLAYVAGPGELAYLPQSEPLYQLLGVSGQQPYPRWAGRVLEPRVRRVLEKFGIGADALDGPEGRLEGTLVRDAMPPAARDALETLRAAISEQYRRLEAAAAEVDPTMRKPVQSAKNSALAGLGELEKRLVQHLKKQNEIVTQQLAKARNALYPLGKPQERVFMVAPYLVRFGMGFLDEVVAAAARGLGALEAAAAGR